MPGPGLPSGNPVIAAPVSLGSHATGGTASSNAITTGTTAPGGSVVIVACTFTNSSTISISSVTDSNGNTYASLVSAGWEATSVSNQEIWFAVTSSSLASGSTITANLSVSSNANSWPCVAAYIAGLVASPKDKTNFTKYTPASGTISSGLSGALTQANEILIGGVGVYVSTTLTEDAAFSQIVDLTASGCGANCTNNIRAHLAYKIVSATTSTNYSPSSSASIEGAAMIGTLKGF